MAGREVKHKVMRLRRPLSGFAHCLAEEVVEAVFYQRPYSLATRAGYGICVSKDDRAADTITHIEIEILC